MKKVFVLLVLLLALLPVSAWAAVAKVGNNEYDSIDDAVAAWEQTPGSTMTLLGDVTLSDVIMLKSTEHHILNLGTYTMTAAEKKHAIQITCNGLSSASYCLTINADSENPGGITAASKSCIYYQKTAKTKDRPIITINGGVYNGSYAINSSSSNKGTNCPQFRINGGTFAGNLSLRNAMLRINGGTFNGWINCQGDSSAYRLIWGGKFSSFQFMTADSNNTKFWIGTSMATSDVGVYVDDQGYLVVGGPVIQARESRFEAYAGPDNFKNYSQYNNFQYYLKYSSANDYGLYFSNAEMALAKSSNAKDKVTVYVDELNLANVNYKGTIVLPVSEDELQQKKAKVLTVDYQEGADIKWTVATESALDPAKKVLIYEDSEAKNGIVTRTYYICDVVPSTTITDKAAAYSVTHYQQQLDGSYVEVTADTQFPLFAKVGETVSAQDKFYKGYHLNTEKTKASAVLAMPQTVDGELVVTRLELYYDLNFYKIVFDTDGGTVITAIEKKYGETVQAPADPTRDGFTFLGWQDAQGNTITFPLDMPLDGQTIKAKWMSNEEVLVCTIINKGFDHEDISEELKERGLNTVEKINTVLQTKAEKLVSDSLGTQLYNVKLVYSVDGGKVWAEADEEYFPENGKLWIELPIPEGTDPLTHGYHVIHMFTTDAFGKVPGETEEPKVSIVYDENGAPKLGFYVTGLSPIMVTWSLKEIAVDLPKTGDDSMLGRWIVIMGMAGAVVLLLRKREYD